MFPLIFCNFCTKKFWLVRTFLSMTILIFVQQYLICLCVVNLYMCTVAESRVQAHNLEGTLLITDQVESSCHLRSAHLPSQLR